MRTSDRLWRLRAILVALEIENQELAEMVGVSRPVVSRLLSGETEPARLKPSLWTAITNGLCQVIQAEPERFLPIARKAQSLPTNRKAGGL